MTAPDADPLVGHKAPGHHVTNTVVATGRAIAIVGGGHDVNVDLTQHHYHGHLAPEPVSKWSIEVARTDFFVTNVYENARSRLLMDQIVVICGARRTGRKTAALNLLREARTESVRRGRSLADLWRLRPSWLHPTVQALPRVKRHGYLLDLSDSTDVIDTSRQEDSRPDSRFGEDLINFSSTLKELGSYLVVVTTPDVWEHCISPADAITARWEPPRPSSVAESHLRGQFGKSERVEWLKDKPFGSLLSDAKLAPGDAVRLARAIANAQPSEKMSASDVALDEFSGWTKYLQQWFRTNEDVQARAYLIAAAVLNGVVDYEVIAAGDQLLRASDEEEVVLKPLRAPDISERLAYTEATVRQNRTVWLTDRRPRLDIAIIDHVWRERPHLRSSLLSWLVGLATAAKVSTARREHIASVLAGVWIRRKAMEELVSFAHVQAKVSAVHHDLAVRILDATVLDPDIGRYVRKRLNGWASGTDPVRLGLTVAVCGGRLGVERTDLALKRLAKVLTNANATRDVIQSAGRALANLAARPDTRAAVIGALANLIEDNPKAGAQTFLELGRLHEQSVVPALLKHAEADNAARTELARLWQATYKAVGTEECASVMCAWVQAIENGLPEDVVLAVCMPTLQLTAAHSLDAKVVSAASAGVADRIMAELVNYKRYGAGANS